MQPERSTAPRALGGEFRHPFGSRRARQVSATGDAARSRRAPGPTPRDGASLSQAALVPVSAWNRPNNRTLPEAPALGGYRMRRTARGGARAIARTDASLAQVWRRVRICPCNTPERGRSIERAQTGKSVLQNTSFRSCDGNSGFFVIMIS